MLKADFEVLLLDEERRNRFCDEMRASRSGGLEGAISPLERVSPTPSEPPRRKPSAAELRNTHRSIGRSYSVADLARSGPPGARGPADGLRAATERFKAKPSAAHATRLEMAINRVTAPGDVDARSRTLVEKAIALLADPTVEGDEDGFRGDNIAVTVFQNSNLKGGSLFFNMIDGITLMNVGDLRPLKFNDKISSLSLQAGADEAVGGRVFLFQDVGYFGRYVQFDALPSQDQIVDYVGSYMNDRTSSLILYRQFPNEIELLLSDFISNDTVAGLIKAQGGIKPRGDVILTWDLFPTGGGGHPNDPYQAFINLRIPITVEVPHWFDYDAEIRFWILPFVDQSGQLQADLSYYGAWVESGIISSQILDKLMSPTGIPSSIGQVSALIAQAVSGANFLGPFSQVFLLPGRNEAKGDTDDDVTMVLVPGLPPPPAPIQ